MKKFQTYLIAIISAIFLSAEKISAAANSVAVTSGIQTKYGVALPPMQELYGVNTFRETVPWYDILHNPIWRNPKVLAIALVPVLIIVGTTVLIVKKRKNKTKSNNENFKKNN